ncbi:ATP-binding cassette domain-containing protein [Spirillospora sp. NBC_01491]|uniref:ATP-binding cassette domain-containing protein n=1 Tax=Spirillospora sp. NBC_01491 TaxID=2976007 RepID=UPI002E2FEDA5|nr:ATP-binding cassette domain-containing protein [Spirillospora sp. NBC_01491]
MPGDEPAPGQGLVASGVTVRFGGVTVLDGAGLDAPPATVTGLIGPDGAGKSTFLDVLAGLRRPSGGTVHLGGADVTSDSAGERARRGLVRALPRPGTFAESGALTVRESVQVAVEIHAMARGTRRRWRRTARRESGAGTGAAADELLARVGIAEHAGRRAGTVPAGVARLLGLARALAAEPAVLLLDEPLAGLPVPESRSLEVLLRDLAAEGPAVLLAEPDLEPVMGVCDVLHVLDHGRVVVSGPPALVRSDPRAGDARPGTAARSLPDRGGARSPDGARSGVR